MRLLSFGSNSNGQLALGHQDDAHRPTTIAVTFTSSFSISDTIIVGGGNHTLLLLVHNDRSTELYAAGSTRLVGNADAKAGAFTIVHIDQPDDKWAHVSAGWEFSVLVSSNNRVYTIGDGARGELGLGSNTTSVSTPTLIPGFPPEGVSITHLHSGPRHTVVVLSNGSCYGWGAGRHGQLGLPSQAVVSAPREVILQDGFKCVKAVCGQSFTVFINLEGQVIVMGDNKHNIVADSPITPLTSWKTIACGWSAIYILLHDGSIVAWGRDNHGQFPPKDLPKVEILVAGSEHAIALEKGGEGRVFGWGWGEHGNLAVEGSGGSEKPTNVIVREVHVVKLGGGKGVLGLGAGCATSWVVMDMPDCSPAMS